MWIGEVAERAGLSADAIRIRVGGGVVAIGLAGLVVAWIWNGILVRGARGSAAPSEGG